MVMISRRSLGRGDSYFQHMLRGPVLLIIAVISCVAVHLYFVVKSNIINLPRVHEGSNFTTLIDSATAKENLTGGSEHKRKEAEDKGSLDEVPLNYTSPNTLCRQVYFWGGGKAGSSTLFFTLTRGPGGLGNPANTGPFVRKFPKEPCQGSEWRQWEALTKDTNICRGGSDSDSFTHILNGCPRETSVIYAQKVVNLCDDPKFLMLIRDPVDRLVSFLNDQVRRGGSKMNIEEAAKRPSGWGLTLAKQGEALKNLLSVVKDPTQILIIPMESISLNGQGVIDAIMDFVDGRRWKRNETDGLHVNNGKEGTYNYVTLSPNTTEILRNKFRQDVQLLESLVGKRFSWSSWARHEDTNSTREEKESKSEAWLVTSPL